MTSIDPDLKAANEIGKIYNSLLEKKMLCDFFLESAASLIKSPESYLFLCGSDNKIWLEASGQPAQNPDAVLQERAQSVITSGKPVTEPRTIFSPLIVRNSIIGVAAFAKNSASETFSEKDAAIANDLSAQAASALKNLLLFEENIRMEKLATIGQTMSMVMHEIKNILQLARLSEEFLKMGIEGGSWDDVKRGQKGMQKALKEMDGFTYEVLSLTKNYKIQPASVHLQSLIEELQKDLAERAAQWRVKLDFAVEETLGEIEGQSRLLYRALLNLVKNAIEACLNDGNGLVRIRARSMSETHYEIVIEDNGHGMSDEVKARIFQAFFSTKGEKGTGLGLLVIDRTVKAHNGEIKVESELAKGTKFTLTFPKKLPKS